MRWITNYDLRSDTGRIERLQRAARTTVEYGLKEEPALFGSGAWWQLIDDGTLPTVLVDGTIEDVYWGSMGDVDRHGL